MSEATPAPYTVQPISALRSMASLIGAALDLLRDAQGIAADARLDDGIGEFVGVSIEALDGIAMRQIRDRIAKLEAEARQ